MLEIVYAIRNTVNDRVYIGRTNSSLEERKTQHFSRLKSKKHPSKLLQFDFDQLGEDKFYIELVEEVESENVKEIEAYWIIKMYLKNRHYNQSIPFNHYKKVNEIMEVEGVWSPRERFGETK